MTLGYHSVVNQIQILYNIYKFGKPSITNVEKTGENFLGNKVVEEFVAKADPAFVRNRGLQIKLFCFGWR